MAKETGYTGLDIWAGQVKEDPLREFHGQEAYKRFNEMRLNNATVGAGLRAVQFVIRGLHWEFRSTEEDDPWLELVNDARDSMTQSWNDFISESLSMLWAGYAVFEKVYQRDERNRILWRKFAPRGQDTVYQWHTEDDGGILGLTQMGAPTYKPVRLDIKDLILFRIGTEKNNPEGMSLLRTAWISYYYLKNLQTFEGIGYERDLNGLPVITLPEGADTDENDSNSDASKAAKIVRNLRNDEQSGLVKPFGWEFDLVSGAGKAFASIDDTIRRYKQELATSFFSQFLLLGQDGVGSLALSENSTDFFLQSVNSIADIISETFTKFAVKPLLMMNGAKAEDADRISLEHTPTGDVNITQLGAFLTQVKDIMTFDETDENWLRQIAGMPEKDIEELAEKRAEKERQKEASARAFAQRLQQTDDEPEQDERDVEQEVDENKIVIFAADPPDMGIRTKREKQFDKDVSTFFEKQFKRVIKEADKRRKMYNAAR